MKTVKIIVEKHTDGYVAYPSGLRGIVVGQGDSYEEALADVKSAITFHLETFGADALTEDATEPSTDQGFYLAYDLEPDKHYARTVSRRL